MLCVLVTIRGVGNQYVSQGKCVVEYWKDDQPQTVDTLTSRNAGGTENARQRPFQRSDSP